MSIVDLGAIVAANQEFIDIENRTSIKGESIKLRANENPLLLIYPLHPQVKPFKKLNIEFNENLVPIGLAFSFPDIVELPDEDSREKDRAKTTGVYIYNNTVGKGGSK